MQNLQTPSHIELTVKKMLFKRIILVTIEENRFTAEKISVNRAKTSKKRNKC